MDEEKMMILKMLEEGKINSKEAMLLLQALGEDKKTKRGESFEEKIEQLNRWGEDFGEKIGSIGESIGEKAASLAERFIEKFLSGTGIKLFDISPFNGMVRELSTTKSWANIPEGLSIDVNGLNGKIELRVYGGDELRAQLNWGVRSDFYTEVDGDLTGIKIVDMLNSEKDPYFSVGYDKDMTKYLNIILWLPHKDYKKVHLRTSNGKICIEKLTCLELTAESSNGRIEVVDARSDEVKCKTSNAKVSLDTLYASSVLVMKSNGKIECTSSEIGDVNFITSNGSIGLVSLKMMQKRNGRIELTNSNGSISLGILDGDDRAYEIGLSTCNGRVTVALGNINYSGKNSFKYKSKDYELAQSSVNIKAISSNGSISVYRETPCEKKVVI
ncbi:DUF4097 family beta strand repeat-containing protein [Caldanaerobius polysaccharolyticus]|uniref:DUF4097 family beta strand repeat-containing protein n=1 Tax=Caldanaerobius polysaccharolyticus TaxID=44256 RepID=UPI000479B389|nr:DUF4097 family beta strand repeat-containing protein [Caldanaerobius polysaccharolyticus]